MRESTFTNAICKAESKQISKDFAYCEDALGRAENAIGNLPSAQPEQHEIGYSECANAMLKMWIDNVLTDGEYNRIMDKLNAHWAERREE